MPQSKGENPPSPAERQQHITWITDFAALLDPDHCTIDSSQTLPRHLTSFLSNNARDRLNVLYDVEFIKVNRARPCFFCLGHALPRHPSDSDASCRLKGASARGLYINAIKELGDIPK